METNTFYGTSEETYFVNRNGVVLCVQSPDLVGVHQYYVCDSLPEGAEVLKSAVDTLDALGICDALFEEMQAEH